MPLYFSRKKSSLITSFDADETFLDAQNLPAFKQEQFEGVIETPITSRVFVGAVAILALFLLIFATRVFALQVVNGERYSERASSNSLKHISVFPERGVIYDRNGVALAWNDETRAYTSQAGFGHLLGYINLPRADEVESKNILPEERIGRDGTERMFDDMLRGTPGTKIIEVDVNNVVQSESVFQSAEDGKSVTLSIDARIEEEFYRIIKSVALERGYSGGAGAIMDVRTGELIAITSYPEYSPAAFFNPERENEIASYINDPDKPFLNRATQGIYTPGSIMKPFVAIAALQENVITPEKVIFTDGVLKYPNPYDPEKPTLFPDWKNHGAVNMYDALAVSSDVYFYQVGGGFGAQAGVGIDRLKKYFTLFGFDATTGSSFPGEAEGLIPDREWKLRTQGEAWGIADTYHTSIGQYSVLITPLQMVRAISAIANGGTLLTPTLLASSTPQGISIPVKKEHFTDVQKGMREAVTRGTATGVSVPFVQMAAKTGTAEIDYAKKYINAWITGFFPYNNPHYAFVVVMERGPRSNTIGGVFVMHQMLDWMNQNTPEYFK